jgi:hypothetical protein
MPGSNKLLSVMILGYDGQGGVLLSVKPFKGAPRDMWTTLTPGVRKLPAGSSVEVEWDDFKSPPKED